MMNLMIVEDEPPILREIQSTINSFQEGYSIESSFCNGQDAIHYLNQYHQKIDVLITDLHLPVIGGLELIEHVSKNYPHILCIILTGYNEFDYAKKALQLNVYEYLLKPINDKELQKVLKKAYTKKCIENITPLKGLSSSPKGNLSLEKTYYYLSYICLGSFPNQSNLYWETIDNYWKKLEDHYLISNLTKDGCNYWLINGTSSSEKVLLLSFSKEDKTLITKLLNQLMESNIYQGITLTIVTLNKTVSIHNLSENTQLLREFLKQHITFGKSQILSFNPNALPHKDVSTFYSKVTKLVDLFEQKSTTLFYNELLSLLRKLRQQEITQKSLHMILNTLLTQCITVCMNEVGMQSLNSYTTIEDLIFLSPNYESLHDNLKLVFEDLFEVILTKDAPSDKHSILLRINSYINKHYKEPINTKIIADKFGFTPAYLSKIFRDYKDLSPADYITNLRIDKAKELLSQSADLSVKEVAAYVGYDDSLYFSKVFKKYTNLSPKSYQKSHTK